MTMCDRCRQPVSPSHRYCANCGNTVNGHERLSHVLFYGVVFICLLPFVLLLRAADWVLGD